MEKYMDKNGTRNWRVAAEECDKLFEDFLPHYKNMLDGEDKIKHFSMGGGWWSLRDHVDKIREEIKDDIQRELVPWIKNEFQKNYLINIENWRPFRDFYLIVDVYLGYKKLFQYKHYVFQLILLYECDGDSDTCICKYCENGEYTPHFGVILFGWRDINYEKLQPENILTVLDDNMVPEWYWAIKE